jgi:hypothetical protein
MPSITTEHSVAILASRPTRQRKLLRVLLICAVITWAGIVGYGMERLWRFKMTPGVAARTAVQWPGSSLITPRPGEATLVMFVHPQCSCTSASLTELRNVLEHAHTPVSAWVLLLQPRGEPNEWQLTRTARQARAIANVTVIEDPDGVEAARFGTQTSGQVMLFNPQGKLLFEGGITGSRGHVGDNEGEESVVSWLNTGAAERREHPVFGCGFHDPQRAAI